MKREKHSKNKMIDEKQQKMYSLNADTEITGKLNANNVYNFHQGK